MRIAVAGGHSKFAKGASEYIDEYTEDRKVTPYVVSYLKELKHTVKNCSNDARTQALELRNECNLANSFNADLFAAIHFNAYHPQEKKVGVEVWYYTGSKKGKKYAEAVSKQLANILDLPNRGAKSTKNLYVLKHTKMPAILVEVCFCDSKGDVKQYKLVGYKNVARTIAEGINKV